MPQTSRIPAHQDSTIDLRDDEAIAFWCGKLQCSEEELRRAIADVGPNALPVAEHLGLTESALA
jgi:Protein of unknown function (DUF3606)